MKMIFVIAKDGEPKIAATTREGAILLKDILFSGYEDVSVFGVPYEDTGEIYTFESLTNADI